jgi:hypothetical protein
MDKEEIIRMAREVGIEFDPRWGTCYTGNVQLERFAALVAAHEREACAKVCDGMDHNGVMIAADCATAIRARSEQ